MGNSKGKQKADFATCRIVFESKERALDADHPIRGKVFVNSKEELKAYGVQVTLEMTEKFLVSDRD